MKEIKTNEIWMLAILIGFFTSVYKMYHEISDAVNNLELSGNTRL